MLTMFVTGNQENLTTENKKGRMLKTLKTL